MSFEQQGAGPEGRPVLAEARRRAIAQALRDSGAVTVAEVEARFGVSPMTARRDLAELERQGVARRTHGGAVLPSVSAHEDSFALRLESEAPAKARLAEEALGLLAPHETVFLDSSSTSFYVARAVVDAGLAVTILTNSLAIMELVATHAGPQVDLIGVGGSLRQLTRSFVGPFAIQTVRGHFADRLFLSVKGVTPNGVLTDADPLEAEVKRAMIEQAAEPVLLIDQSKLATRGLSAIGPVNDLAAVIVHGARGTELSMMRAAGVTLRAVGGDR